jgi:multicomponent Na+:H+ antiporter subunit C
MTRGQPPLVPAGRTSPPLPHADPTPQALILTAIVIGFGVLAFALVLTYRTYHIVGTDDLDELRRTDA